MCCSIIALLKVRPHMEHSDMSPLSPLLLLGEAVLKALRDWVLGPVDRLFISSRPPTLPDPGDFLFSLAQLLRWISSLSGRKVLPQLLQGIRDTSLYYLKASLLYDSKSIF